MTTVPAARQRTAEIRQRMRAIRSDIPQGMEEARENVSNLLDWKHYVRSYPEVVLPIVAVAAYSVVPQPKPPVTEQVAYVDGAEGVRRVRLVEDASEKKSIISGIVGSLMTLALRQGSNLAMRHLSQVLYGQNNSHSENKNAL